MGLPQRNLAARPPAFAIVDLGFNGGGTDATADFAKELPGLISDGGPVYILTPRETFSAGIGASAQFKEYAGARALGRRRRGRRPAAIRRQ